MVVILMAIHALGWKRREDQRVVTLLAGSDPVQTDQSERCQIVMKTLIRIPGSLTVTVATGRQRLLVRIVNTVATGALYGKWLLESVCMAGSAFTFFVCSEQRVTRLGKVVERPAPAVLVMAVRTIGAVAAEMHIITGMTTGAAGFERLEDTLLHVAVTAGE